MDNELEVKQQWMTLDEVGEYVKKKIIYGFENYPPERNIVFTFELNKDDKRVLRINYMPPITE